jgi:hypothetical protein
MGLIAFLLSCNSTQSPVETKLDKKSEIGMKGNWTITSVDFPGSEYFKVTSFNIDDSSCFVGSQWKFVSNNNTGEMSLQSGKCSAYSSKITWYVNRDGNVVMKFLTPSVKSKHTTSGYVIRLANQTEQSFQLIDRIDVGGQKKDIIYQFTRN